MKTVPTVLAAFMFVFLSIQTLNAQQEQTNLLLITPPMLAASITTPDPFSFTPQSNVPRYTFIVSEEITVTGIRRAIPISITGGFRPIDNLECFYSIDNNEFTNTSGEVLESQSVRIRAMSSFLSGGSSSCTLTVGSVSSTFRVTTLIPPRTQNCADGELIVWGENGREMWQRCDDGKYYTAEQALDYCANLKLGGYDDWYMPYSVEMDSLLVCDIGIRGCVGAPVPSNIPTIDPVFQCSPERYWFTGFAPFPGGGVYYGQVDFATGRMDGTTTPAKIRCQRFIQ